ncbi:MAG: type I-E CRISPR-associated protein Cas7/Cse4/CasC [Chloroflexi bacterium]|nr:type I-E CRISPR-associated protein Cas7/Cse4/CasC [Chloroflexota bacterium]
MTTPRFVQIHTLHSYPAALLNRDDSGLAKRMPFGGTVRTRISSQCLKRHWRTADDEFALTAIEGAADAIRSRNVVDRSVIAPLRAANGVTEEVLNAVQEAFNAGVYGSGGTTESGRQPLLLGQPEVEYLQRKARAICAEHQDDADAAGSAAADLFTRSRGNEERDNFTAFREQTSLPGGLIGALFGRMVTSDPGANIDAAIHVAHAFTVHSEESESDYFSVVDDLQEADEDAGAAHIGDMELTAGLFYGYVVVDVPSLVSNLSGSSELASKVVEHLLHLIATVSPGAKLGSTAPYAYADLMLVEAGLRQPRSLANAFRNGVDAQSAAATTSLAAHLAKLDECYGMRESRRVMSLDDSPVPGAVRLNIDDLASWAGDAVRSGEA